MEGQRRIYLKVKRVLDIVMATILFIIGLPICFIVALWIKIEDPNGKILFKQKRIGKDKSIFWIYKFRSMYASTPDIPTHLLTNPNQYITKIGRVLRKTSLDELPQVINVLKGEMSFIGPRPALWNQYDLIDLREKENANSVRPGISGLAQVNGRDELPIEIKAHFDGDYVRGLSFKMDCMIFLKTIKSVLFSRGIVEGKKEGQGEHSELPS